MDRREFLAAAGVGLGIPFVAAGTDVDHPVIHFVDDVPAGWFAVKYGWLDCVVEPLANGRWRYEASVFLARQDEKGGLRESRLVPSVRLKESLASAGLPLVFDGTVLPSLVGEMDKRLEPADLLRKIANVGERLGGEGEGWHDPWPWEWGKFVRPVRKADVGMWLAELR